MAKSKPTSQPKKPASGAPVKRGQHPNSRANLDHKKGEPNKGPRRAPTSTDKIDMFCIALLTQPRPNARQAAIQAGFSPQSARYLLQREDVQKRLKEIDAEALRQKVALYCVGEGKQLAKPDNCFEVWLDIAYNSKNEWARLKAAKDMAQAMGLIVERTNGTIINNTAAAGVLTHPNGAAVIDVTKPLWLQQYEANLMKQVDERYKDKLAPADGITIDAPPAE